MSKQTATINNWRLIRSLSGGFVLTGVISDHPRQADFVAEVQQTSGVILFDPVNKTAETYNTIYTLGDQHPDDAPKKAK